MCVFLISPVPTAEPITSELIDTPVFHNLAPRRFNTEFRYPSLCVCVCVYLNKKRNNVNKLRLCGPDHFMHPKLCHSSSSMFKIVLPVC